jgi:signal transduction histidine kinase
MHEISRQIHPAILDDLGLAEALKSECLIFSDLYQTPVAFRAERVPGKLPEEVALCLYRIAQEGLRNIGKHARHAEAAVTLTGTGGGLRLSIEDAGPGTRIDPAARHGLGLISIKERARLVKGKVRVVSRPGRGTVVKVDVPLGTGAAGPMKPAARRHAASRS